MPDSSGWGPYGGAPGGPSGPYGGAPGGWGWMPPPPPKPGVIPLAPLGVDRIPGGAFATMRRYAKPLLVSSLLYIDQRIRREGLADVLMRAAAVTETPGGPDTPEGPAAPGGPEAPGSVH